MSFVFLSFFLSFLSLNRHVSSFVEGGGGGEGRGNGVNMNQYHRECYIYSSITTLVCGERGENHVHASVLIAMYVDVL